MKILRALHFLVQLPSPGILTLEFSLACRDCFLILLTHASHYSTDLVRLLLKQQRELPPLSEISVKASVGPYLEVTISFLDKYFDQLMLYSQQFEHHIDAPPELKVFLEKYRASKCPDSNQ
jgi:hypothetical protein